MDSTRTLLAPRDLEESDVCPPLSSKRGWELCLTEELSSDRDVWAGPEISGLTLPETNMLAAGALPLARAEPLGIFVETNMFCDGAPPDACIRTTTMVA